MDKWYINDKLYICWSKVNKEIKRKGGWDRVEKLIYFWIKNSSLYN